MTTASLLGLPNELILEILHYIDSLKYPWRRIALYGFNIANRRLHHLSRPYLYSTLSFYGGVPYLFVRTICRNPELASYVKTVEWDYETGAVHKFSYETNILPVRQYFKLDDARGKIGDMAEQGNEVAKCIQEELNMGRVYMGDLRALHVVLMFASNVEHLAVVETYRWDDHSYWFMPFHHGHTGALSRLTSATLIGPMRLQNVTALLTLPTMRRLELTHVIEMRREHDRTLEWESSDDSNQWKTFLEKSGSEIEHFHLYDSYVNLNEVKVAVRSMRKLKSFTYEHEAHELSPNFMQFNYEAVAKLIESQSDSLMSLRVVIKQSTMAFIEIPDDPNILYNVVKNLPKLVDLEIPCASPDANFQTPVWQELAASLEHLALDSSNNKIYDAAKDFTDLEQNLEALAACKKRGELPMLRSLTLKRWHPWYGCIPTNVSYIKAILQEVGIQFASVPAAVGSNLHTMHDIGWVELQTEPEWVLVERFLHDFE